MPQNVCIHRLDEIVVRAGVDYFQRGGFLFVRAENENERIDLAPDEPGQELRALANSAGCDGKCQKENVELGFLQKFVSGFVVLALEYFKVRSQR
jgi:hypothetical protein